MRILLRRLKHLLADWWRCQRHRCDYYTHYLIFGPPDLTHQEWHGLSEAACAHFLRCGYRRWPRHQAGLHQIRPCPTCVQYEQEVRA